MSDNSCATCCPFCSLFRWLWGTGSMDNPAGWLLAPARFYMYSMFFEAGMNKFVHFSTRAVGAAKSAGFPAASLPVMAACLVIAELGGAFLMLIGVGVRLAALLQGIVLLVILTTVHSEIALTLEARRFHIALAICIVLFILGNGRPTLLPGGGKRESCQNKS